MNEFVTLRLVDGSTLMGILEIESETEYMIENPIQVVVEDNKLIMQDYVLLSDNLSYPILKKHVIIISSLAESYIKQYIRFTTKDTVSIEEKPVQQIIVVPGTDSIN